MNTVTVGRRAPDALLQGAGDREVRLSELWEQAPTVFFFLRHFG